MLLYGLFSGNKSITAAALVTLVAVSLFCIPTYLSGEEAEHVVESIIGINKIAMESHEEQAEIAFWVLLMNGAIALGTLISAYKTSFFSKPLLWINLLLLIIVVALMTRTGNSGGQIRHSEINATAQLAKNLNSGKQIF
ncbi:MAG: hypothetical protein IPP71_04795 [Bacteroidetes bacterium]|nr:hypothetical protein [Bacteroidota bacterium]